MEKSGEGDAHFTQPIASATRPQLAGLLAIDVLSDVFLHLCCQVPPSTPSPDFCEQKSPSPARTRERDLSNYPLLQLAKLEQLFLMSTLVAGKYELIQEIAKGGMAEVFLAKQKGHGGFEKLVVLKRILPHLAHQPSYVQMFLDEARLLADLRHSNLVSTFEVGQDRGIYFMAMEFLYGQDVRSLIKHLSEQEQKIPLEIALGIVIGVTYGLDYAHRLKVVHRDVSPQNIIVTYEGEVKIVDFGIAKTSFQSEKTAVGVLKGKYSYMSPEQVAGKSIDGRTDVFALGIVLYELTTMQRLFKRPSDVLTLQAVADCEIVPPSQVVSDYPCELESILLTALAKEPKDRFRSCAEFCAALEKFSKQETLSHSQASIRRFMRETFAERLKKDEKEGIEKIDLSWGESSFGQTVPPIEKKAFFGRAFLGLVTFFGGLVGAISVFLIWGDVGKSERARVSETPMSLEIEGNLDQISLGAYVSRPAPVVVERSPSPRPSPLKGEGEKPQEPGRLKIVVEPWANIYVDGKMVGTTPMGATELKPGRYVLKLENPDLQKQWQDTVTIKPGRDTLIRHQF